MHLLEVALQGVRGFSPTVRIPLQTGYTVLQPPVGEAAALGALLTEVLYADGRGVEAGFRARPEEPARVALTLAGNDGGVLRLGRELGGRAVLQRVNRTSQKMEVVAEDGPSIVLALQRSAGLPARAVFEELCLLARTQRPSVRAVQTVHSAPLVGAAPVVPSFRDLPAARARRSELEAELAQAREVADLQFQANELESELYRLSARLSTIDRPRQALAEAQQALARAPTPTSLGLPDDILLRVERLPAAERRRDEQLARLAAERDPGPEAPDGSGVESPLGDRRFLAAVGAGVACLLLGLLLPGAGRVIALLDIPLFAFAAMRGIRFVEDLQRAERRTRHEGMREARERKILEDFEAEVGPVLQGMAALRVETPEALVAALTAFSTLGAEVERRRAELTRAERDPARQADLARQGELQAELARVSAELEEKGGFVRDVLEVERELAQVRDALALAEGHTLPGAPAGGLREPIQDPCPRVLGLAAELLRADVPAAIRLVQERVQQYFAALTDKRHGPLAFDAAGHASVQGAIGTTPATALLPRDLDLLYLALRFTLAEKLSAPLKLPLLVDEAFEGLDEAKRGLIARMLRHLGTLTQVVQVTAHPAFVSDHTGML